MNRRDGGSGDVYIAYRTRGAGPLDLAVVTTTVRDRKRLLRRLIDEVHLRTEAQRHLVRIVWLPGRQRQSW